MYVRACIYVLEYMYEVCEKISMCACTHTIKCWNLNRTQELDFKAHYLSCGSALSI